MRELVGLAGRREEFDRLGIQVYALSTQPLEKLAPLQEDLGKGVTLLSDEGGVAVSAFGMAERFGLARAGSFLIDREGRVTHRWLAENYRKRPSPDDILAKARD
ncbi:MAG TPA: redoxin domain-containing protein [Planctomycetota bacterium]|nr:redoxin domain-containing protein [Planctomycetota bacterium]